MCSLTGEVLFLVVSGLKLVVKLDQKNVVGGVPYEPNWWSNWTRKTKWVAHLMSQLCDQNLVLIGPRLTGEVRLG